MKVEKKVVETRLSTVKKAMQTEAQEVLRMIAKKEAEYFTINGTYTKEYKEIEAIIPVKGNYVYTIEKADQNAFVVSAKGNIDSDPFEDYWVIDQTGKLQHIFDDIQN